MNDMILTFEGDEPGSVFEVNTESRTIKGLVLPYGVIGNNGQGRYMFSEGTVSWPTDLSRVKLLVSHDFSQAIGHATALESTPKGVIGTFKVARGAKGDEALSMAQDKVWDGLSAGIGRDAKFKTGEGGVQHALSAPLAEVSQTPLPAFDEARVTSVAASAAQKKGNDMPENETAQVEEQTAPVTLSAADIQKMVNDGVKSAVEAFTAEAPKPAAGAPVGATLEVNEPRQYRFDGIPADPAKGEYDFSTDLIAGLGLGAKSSGPDGEAYARVIRFMKEELTERFQDGLGPKFVTTTNVSSVNPTGYRPDMYVDYQKYSTPLRDAFFKGTLTDVTPFAFPKFNAASGLVGDHTQGTEPTAGSFSTAAGGTVTPAPVSGKVHITREVADQGGNPQVSALIWNRIQYDYGQAMETKAAAILSGASPSEWPSALAVGASTVANLAVPIEQAIANLNFQAGGDRFDFVAVHKDLYLAMSGLKDGQSRPYWPTINPTNANGTSSNGLRSIDVLGKAFSPVWSLGTTTDGTPHKSYVCDTSAIFFWHSAPTRLDKLMEDVEGYDLGVWGYQAGVLADPSGLLKVTYDPS